MSCSEELPGASSEGMGDSRQGPHRGGFSRTLQGNLGRILRWAHTCTQWSVTGQGLSWVAVNSLPGTCVLSKCRQGDSGNPKAVPRDIAGIKRTQTEREQGPDVERVKGTGRDVAESGSTLCTRHCPLMPQGMTGTSPRGSEVSETLLCGAPTRAFFALGSPLADKHTEEA